MRRLPTYRGDCAVKTWLFGIARNAWLESLRKRRPDRQRRRPAGDLPGRGHPDRSTPTPACNGSGYCALLQQKDDRARRVVQLRAEGYSYAEIAARLGISESSARVIEHRTRSWLKRQS